MSKSVREQLSEAIDALLEACRDVERNVFTPKVESFASRLADRDKRMWAVLEVVKNNATLFAAAEDNAKEVARLRGVMAQVADILSDASYKSEAQAANVLRAALQPQGGE